MKSDTTFNAVSVYLWSTTDITKISSHAYERWCSKFLVDTEIGIVEPAFHFIFADVLWLYRDRFAILFLLFVT